MAYMLQNRRISDLLTTEKVSSMNGVLKEAIDLDKMQLLPGTSVYIDIAQAQIYDKMPPEESLVVSVALKYFTIRARVKKSQIQLAA